MVPEYRFPLKRKRGFLHIGTSVSNLRNWSVKPSGILSRTVKPAALALSSIPLRSISLSVRRTVKPAALALSSIPLRSISLSVRRTVDTKREPPTSKLASVPFLYLSRLC